MESQEKIKNKVVSLFSYRKENQEKKCSSKQGRDFFENNMIDNKLNKQKQSILREKSNLSVLKNYKIKP